MNAPGPLIAIRDLAKTYVVQRLNRDQQITIVLVTHEPDIAEYATRIVAFRDGRVRLDESVAGRRDAVEELRRFDAETAAA